MGLLRQDPRSLHTWEFLTAMKRNLALSLLTALLLALAVPPSPLGALGWFALLPLFLLLERKSVAEAWRWGYLTGLFVAIATLYWIAHVTQAGFAGAIVIIPLYLSLYSVVHVLLLRHYGGRAWCILPFVWLSVEYLQSLSELAFPWNFLGYTQSYYLPLIQYAEYTGIWGISFVVFCLNVLSWTIWRRGGQGLRTWQAGVAIMVLLLIPATHGLVVMRQTVDQPEKGIKVSLLQGNVDPFEKWEAGATERNVALYETMTRRAAAGRPDLIVWPETALPFYLRSEDDYLRRVQHLADSIGIPLLTGSLDYHYTSEDAYDYYNAAFLIKPSAQLLQVYHKMRLVPGSERIPYGDYFPFRYAKAWLTDLALGVGDYASGEEYTRFAIQRQGGDAELFFSTPICYESVFPDINRDFKRRGANFLCIITNDAWFGRTSAPYQHLRFAVFRAIENRLPIARCANTGISCFIDACGRVSQQTAIFTQTAITGTLQPGHKQTFYTRFGDWFAGLCVVVTVASLVAAALRLLRARLFRGTHH